MSGPFRLHLKIPQFLYRMENLNNLYSVYIFLFCMKLDSKVPVTFVNNSSELYENLES